MSIWDGIWQGIIQGLTEFLPISSSGHLSLYQYFTGNNGEGSLFFSLMLHLGTLAAVIAAYYEDLWGMIKEVGAICSDLFAGRFTFKAQNPNRKMLYMLIVGCVPLFLALALNRAVSYVSGDNDIVIEGICFLFTSLMLFAAVKARPGKAGVMKMKPVQAGIVGLMQSVASFPGISRSGATISTGMILGFDRAFMVKYSFLLGIPAILGGVVFEIGDAAAEKAEVPFWPLFIGMLVAAVVGYLSIRLVRWLVVTNRLVIFAWYTLVLGAAVVVLGVIGHFAGWGTAPGGAEKNLIIQAMEILKDLNFTLPAPA